MEIQSESPSVDRAKSNFWLKSRFVLLLSTLAAEILSLSLVYDLHPLRQSTLPVLRVVGYGTTIFRILAVAIIALLVIERHSLSAAIQRWVDLSKNDGTFAWMCAGHAVSAVCFALMSQRILRSNGDNVLAAEACLWVFFGGLAFFFWLAALVPIRFWTEFARWRMIPDILVSLLIGVAVHFAIDYSIWLWYPLSNLTLAASEWVLRLVAVDVVSNPATRMLGTRQFQVEIAPVCSGFEGIALVVVSLTLFLVMFRKELRFPQSLCLLPFGIVSIWLCNVLRIVALILIGAHISPAIAIGGFHSQAGWIGFAAVTLVIGFVALRSPVFAKCETKSVRASSRVATPSAAYLMPFLAMIAAAMVAAALSSGFDNLYPMKIMVGLAVLACFITTYRSIPWSWSWLAAMNGVVVFALWLGLERFSNRDETQLANGLQQLPHTWAIVWLGFRAIGSTTIVPISEELAFRGYLMRRVTSANFNAISYRQCSWLAVLISSLFFGLLHGRWFAGALAGLFYALATRRRNLLCDAVTAHSVTNGLIAIYVLLSGSWQLWS